MQFSLVVWIFLLFQLIKQRTKIAPTFGEFERLVDQLYNKACEQFDADPIVQKHQDNDITQ